MGAHARRVTFAGIGRGTVLEGIDPGGPAFPLHGIIRRTTLVCNSSVDPGRYLASASAGTSPTRMSKRRSSRLAWGGATLCILRTRSRTGMRPWASSPFWRSRTAGK